MDARYALHSLSSDEVDTCAGILQGEPTAHLTMMPTHHMDPDGHLSGFRFSCHANAPASCLPISRQMFFGHAAVECHEVESRITEIIQDKHNVRLKLKSICEQLASAPHQATMDCIPENTDSVVAHRHVHAIDLRTADAQDWVPAPPVTLGVYHAYVRGYSRDLRVHKLFICCNGGLDTAADEFCNLMIDVGGQWTAKDAAESMETWWLRRASQRSRARLLKMAADAIGVSVDSLEDANGYEQHEIAIPCTDTFQHDLVYRGPRNDSVVTVYNGCTSTTARFNGILVRMAPSEGMRIYQGANTGSGYGSVFGDHKTCGVFPVCQPRITKRPEAVPISDAEYVCRQVSSSDVPRAQTPYYMCFDEAYHQKLAQMQWNRDNGIVEMIPIAVWARDGV